MEDLGLEVKFGGDSTEAQRAVTDLQAKTESFSQRIKSLGEAVFFPIEAFKKLKDIGEHVFDALVGKSYEAALKLEHLHKQTGISTDSLQRLGKAAKMNEVSLDAMAHSMAILQRNMGAALGGSKEAAAAFQSIGISVGQLKTMKPEDVFIKLADAIKSGAIPESEQMGIAMKVLGRGAFEMMPLLRAGGDEIRKIGASASIMSRETIEASEATHKAWLRIEGAFTAVSNKILENVIPAVSKVSEWLADKLPIATNAAKAGIDKLVVAFGVMYDEAQKWFGKAKAVVQEFIDVFGGPLEDGFKLLVTDIGLYLKPFTNEADSLFGQMKVGMREVGEVAGEMANDVVNALGAQEGGLKGAAKGFLNFGSSAKAAFDEAVEDLRYWGDMAGRVVGVVINGYAKIPEVVKQVSVQIALVWADLKDVAFQVAKAIGDSFYKALTFQSVGMDFTEVGKAMDRLKGRVQTGMNEVLKAAAELWTELGKTLETTDVEHNRRLQEINDEYKKSKAINEATVDALYKQADALKQQEATLARLRNVAMGAAGSISAMTGGWFGSAGGGSIAMLAGGGGDMAAAAAAAGLAKLFGGGAPGAGGGGGAGPAGGGVAAAAQGAAKAIKGAEDAKDSFVKDATSEVPKATKVISDAGKAAKNLSEEMGDIPTQGPVKVDSSGNVIPNNYMPIGAPIKVDANGNMIGSPVPAPPAAAPISVKQVAPVIVKQAKGDSWRVENGGSGMNVSGASGGGGAAAGLTLQQQAAMFAGINYSRGRLGQDGVLDLMLKDTRNIAVLMASGFLTQEKLDRYDAELKRLTAEQTSKVAEQHLPLPVKIVDGGAAQEAFARFSAGMGPASNWTTADLAAQKNAPSVHVLGPVQVTGPGGSPVEVSGPDKGPIITSPDLDRWRGGLATTGKVEEISAMLAGGQSASSPTKQDVKIAITQNVGKIDSSVDTQRMLTDLGRKVATELRKAGPLVA